MGKSRVDLLTSESLQRSPLQPRTFEAFQFLDVPEIYERGTPGIPCREYKAGTLEMLKEFDMFKSVDPTPSIPYVGGSFHLNQTRPAERFL